MKKNIDLARAWRDEDYYLSLSAEDRASLGENPAGVLGVQDEALKSIAGGCSTSTVDYSNCNTGGGGLRYMEYETVPTFCAI
ncbi:MAG TPA: mersacidin/lichenicidin family type 2 lantibiotic [Thermoanaerobaculia bacterium]|nr:mersacidin/lichenicidin family type 2 lantibiotic [Thermoanaerobaculia bacterium]